MQNDQFSRLLKFAQRTGDRLIVTDPSGSEPIVILPMAEYESLMDAVLGVPDEFETGEEFSLPDMPWAEESPESAEVEGSKNGEPPLHVIEREEATPPAHEPVPAKAPEPKMAQDGGEERFYLEPI